MPEKFTVFLLEIVDGNQICHCVEIIQKSYVKPGILINLAIKKFSSDFLAQSCIIQ